MWTRIRELFNRSLGAKALAVVVVAVGLTMAASTHYHFYSTSKEAESELHQRGELLSSVLADTLARPLFDFNHTAVRSAIDAIGASREVGAIRVLDPQGTLIASSGNWSVRGDDAFPLKREIHFADGTRDIEVGQIEILVLRERMQNELREVLLRIIATNVLLAATIVLFLFALTWRTRQDFLGILGALEALRSGGNPDRIPGLGRNDEVGSLAQAVDSFREAISQRRAAELAQQKLQDELQQERDRAAKEALDRSQEQYRLVVENVSEGIVVVQDGHVVFANPRVSQLVGESDQSIRERPFLDFVHPDDRELVLERHRRRLQGETIEPRYAFRVIDHTGKSVWVELSAVVIEWQGKPSTLSFITDISQRRKAEEDIRQALEKQRELNNLKSRFVSMTSHEFRTPLATILSSVELLKYYSDRLPQSEKEDLIASIENAIRRMTKMLDDVLVIGKADAGKLEFKPKEVHISRLGKTLAEEAARAATPKGGGEQRLDFRISCDDGARMMDDILLRHIVGNLVSNAFKYSPADSRVSFAIEADDANVRLTVRDEGIGIPPADLPRLFETFHRATNVGNISGTGLGMTIVRRSVDLHGGEITVESIEGKGSTFHVTLPAPRC